MGSTDSVVNSEFFRISKLLISGQVQAIPLEEELVYHLQYHLKMGAYVKLYYSGGKPPHETWLALCLYFIQ